MAAAEVTAAEEAPLLELEARILRKHVKAPGLIFVDALLLEGGEPREGLLVLSSESEGTSPEEVAAWRALRAGDAVLARGRWGQAPRGSCYGFRVQRLELAEAHHEVHGEFAFTSAPVPVALATVASAETPGGDAGAPALQAPSLPAAPAVAPPLAPVRLVLQCGGPQAARLAAYCSETFPGTPCSVAAPHHGCLDRVLLLRPGTDAEIGALLQRLAADGSVAKVLRRAFVVGHPPCCTLQGAVARLAALAKAEEPGCVVRVQVFPKYLQRRAVEGLHAGSGGSLRMECVNFSHVASIAYADAVYYVGLAPRALLCSEGARGLDVLAADRPRSPEVCRASSKLREALTRSGWEAELASRRPRRALDVGAAPGSWSACLCSAWGCEEVLAVDPGELARGLLEANREAAARGAAGRIRHLRMRWEEAFAQLKEDGASVDVLTCDANVPCDQTLDLLEAADTSGLLAPRAYLVLTFKNCSRTKSDFERLKAEQLVRLGRLCDGMREVQLLANRKLETTVLGRFAGARAAPRDSAARTDRGEVAKEVFCGES